ncbi:MAG: SCO6880 family protein [Sporichthyaceae bacterium]
MTTLSRTSAPTALYGGWQRERLGFLFGLSGPRFALAVLALLLAVAPVATGSLAVLVVAWPLALLVAALTWTRVLGRSAVEWTGIALGHGLNRVLGRATFLSGAMAPRAADPAGPAPMDLPGLLAPLRFLDTDTQGLLGGLAPSGRIAVVHHPLDRTFTAVARVRWPGIALADTERRDARVAGWGGLLAQLCSEASPFTRVSVVQRTLPDDGSALRRWTANAVRSDAPAIAVDVVEELTAQARLTGAAHDAWLVFTLDTARARAQIRANGGGDAAAATVLVRQLAAVSTAVGAAHLEVVQWLGVRDLAEVVRTAFDPDAAEGLAARRNGVGPLAAGVEPSLAGPAAAQAAWGHYRHDGAWSVTYGVHDWPRTGVPAWFLRPVLTAQSTARRSVALHVEPVAAREAEKVVMRARTKRSVAVAMRHRTGQLVPEHERLAQRDAHEQDAQRAQGHGLVRLVGYLTVTVTDHADLDLACSELETDAAQAGLEVRRLWGAQDAGFHATAVPLGIGLPKRKAIG